MDPLCIGPAVTLPVAALELGRWWKRRRARKRYAAVKAALPVKPATVPSSLDRTETQDDFLRRGYHLYDAIWLANRTLELNGNTQAAEHELALTKPGV